MNEEKLKERIVELKPFKNKQKNEDYYNEMTQFNDQVGKIGKEEDN